MNIMTAMRSNFSRRESRLRATSCAMPLPSASFQTGMGAGRMGLWWMIGLALIWSAFWLTTRPAAAQSFQIFVPMIVTQGAGPGGSSGEPTDCGLSEEELEVAQMFEADPNQERDKPVCNTLLAEIARARARDMALRDYFSHTNPDGDGPNLIAREAGYPLPDWYSNEQNANNIESIGAGYQSANEAWQGWLNSSSHRTHVLGSQSFYAGQDAYGVGHYFDPNSTWGHYWVFLSAPVPEEE
jgi:uncharacterized protein YkwD